MPRMPNVKVAPAALTKPPSLLTPKTPTLVIEMSLHILGPREGLRPRARPEGAGRRSRQATQYCLARCPDVVRVQRCPRWPGRGIGSLRLTAPPCATRRIRRGATRPRPSRDIRCSELLLRKIDH